jgi:PPP family 3-phenylpropionic acid transporter
MAPPAPEHPVAPDPATPRFLAFYAGVFAAFGAASPFLPALLQERGLSPAALGVALAAGTAIRLLTGPLGGQWADRRASRGGSPKRVLAGFVAASAVLALAYGPASGLLLLTTVSLMHAAVLAPVTPIADALATQAAGRGGGFRYGWARGTGSAAFVAATLLSGQAVGTWGLAAIIPLNAGLLAAAAVVALLLPEAPGRSIRPETPRPPVSALLRVPGFVPLMGIAALIGGSHAMHDGFEVIRWREAGMTPTAASVLWSASVLSEVLVFVVAGPALLRRLGPAASLALAAAAGVVRWSAAAFTASFPVMAMVEPLHGFTFALVHLTCVTAIGRIVPAGLTATALAFYATVALGISGSVVTLGSGPLYGWLGASAFWVMAALCAAAFPLALRLRLPAGPAEAS